MKATIYAGNGEIHDVGCSCRDRIRELEAELARTRADSMKWDVIQKRKEKEQYDRAERGWERVEELAKKLGDATARAEKAEKERDDWKECAESMQQERDQTKARVAELEARVKWLEDPKNWVDEYGQPDEGHFAREREAE